MKKFRRAWKQTSKKLRFLLYVLINVALITAIYTFVSAPAFTTEILYRRYEKANLVAHIWADFPAGKGHMGSPGARKPGDGLPSRGGRVYFVPNSIPPN